MDRLKAVLGETVEELATVMMKLDGIVRISRKRAQEEVYLLKLWEEVTIRMS